MKRFVLVVAFLIALPLRAQWVDVIGGQKAPSGIGVGGLVGQTVTAASSITISEFVTSVTGSATIATINGLVSGRIYVIIPAAGSTWKLAVGGNISRAFTPVPGEPILIVKHGTTVRIVASEGGKAVLSVTEYGAACDGATDDGAAINAAMAALTPLGGGIAEVPGTCAFSTPLTIPGGVWLRGFNNPKSTVPAGSVLKWTGTGAGSAITALSVSGPVFSNLFYYGSNSAFTGVLLNVSGTNVTNTAPVIIKDNAIGASTDQLDTLLKVDFCNNTLIDNNFFAYGTVQIQGATTNVINITNNQFTSYATAAISDPHQNWTINHNNFEPGKIKLAGTLTVTNGNTAVTGSGTTFTANVGGSISINVGGVISTVNIASVNNDTSITLSSNWAGTTSSSATATIPLHKVIQDVTHGANSVAFTNNWIGDSTASNMVMLELGGSGYHIAANYVGAVSGTGNIFARCVSNCLGFTMNGGNVIGANPQTVVDFNGATALLSRGYTIAGNVINSSTSVSTLTSAGTTATATTVGNHNLSTGEFVNISGAVQTEYNGRYVITKISALQFSYVFAGSGTSPATGTIIETAPFINQTASNPTTTTYTIGPNSYVSGVLGGVGIDRWKLNGPVTNMGQYYAALWSSVGQVTATGVRLAVLWDSEDSDVGNLHSVAANTDRITVPADGGGVWKVCAHVVWANDAAPGAGRTLLTDIFKNGGRISFAFMLSANLNAQTQETCKTTAAVAGDFFQVGATPTGPNPNVLGGGRDFSWFTAEKLF